MRLARVGIFKALNLIVLLQSRAGLRLPGVPSPGPPTGAEQSRLIVGNGVLSMLIGRGLTSGRV